MAETLFPAGQGPHLCRSGGPVASSSKDPSKGLQLQVRAKGIGNEFTDAGQPHRGALESWGKGGNFRKGNVSM